VTARATTPAWRVIARRELTEILVSPKFVWTFSVASVLLLLTFWVGARGHLLEQRRYEAALAADLRQLVGVTDWLEVSPSVGLPPQPLEALVSGVAADIGRTARVDGRGAVEPAGSRYGAEPVAALLRLLDLEFVFGIVLSLFALLLGYDAVAGERSRGTLRLCFAGGLSRASFLTGKIVGALAGLVLPLTVPLALGALIFRFAGVTMSATDWLRLALVLLGGLLYLAAFLALATWISTLTRQPGHAFFLALSAWVLLVLVWPRAAVSLTARHSPVLSRDAIFAARTELSNELWAADRETFRREMEAVLGGGPDGTPPEVRMARVNELFERQAAERDRRLQELDRQLLERRRAEQGVQRGRAFALARLSPAAAFTLSAQELAGTSLVLEDELRRQLVRYQEELGRFQAEKTGGRRSGGGFRIKLAIHDSNEEPEIPQPIDPSELPRLVWQPLPLAPAVARAALDLGLLLVFTLGAYAAAFVGFQRYDLR
jgi:hypothetical protein